MRRIALGVGLVALGLLAFMNVVAAGEGEPLQSEFGVDSEKSTITIESYSSIYWENVCSIDSTISTGVYISDWSVPDNTYHFLFVPECTPAGIVGLSLSYSGPFTPTLVVPVSVVDGYGRTPFYVKVLQPGTAVIPGPCADEATWLCVEYKGPDGVWYDAWGLAIGSVESVTFEMIEPEAPLDPNPGPGGGLRIFPGKWSPSDIRHNRVKVTAYTSAPGLEVFFKSFDVDDPSSPKPPIDLTGDPLGDDNNGFPPAGTLSSSSAISGEGGIAEVEFEVTMQPGDNFRVAAACDSSYLAGVEVSGTDLVDAYGDPLPNSRAKVTEMLTVWRYLHIERDSMGPVTGNYLTGTVTKVQSHSNHSVLYLDPPPGQENAKRFESGRIWIGAPSYNIYTVKSNGHQSVSVLGPVNWTEVGQPFTLVDDDDCNGDDAGNPDGDNYEYVPAPNIDLMQDSDNFGQNRFVPAYVRPIYDLGGQNNVPFVLNTAADTSAALRATYRFDNIASEADSDFWTVYLLGAYQHTTNLDNDPEKGEKAIFGAADCRNCMGVSVFHETAKDWGFNSAFITAHEVGHLFGGDHKDGCLMSNRVDCNFFSDETIVRIRSISHP